LGVARLGAARARRLLFACPAPRPATLSGPLALPLLRAVRSLGGRHKAQA